MRPMPGVFQAAAAGRGRHSRAPSYPSPCLVIASRKLSFYDVNMKATLALLASAIFIATSALAHNPVMQARTAVNIPDVPGYVTLKCDFHIHTVFSDGYVWPTVRADEAWREGLDAIAITDHIHRVVLYGSHDEKALH